MVSRRPPVEEFDFLTAKQKAALDLLANHRTSKEIAHALNISETSVNRRIEVVKLRLGGITRLELARRYGLWLSANGTSSVSSGTASADKGRSPCVESIGEILQLAELPGNWERPSRDGGASETAFEDPVGMSIESPWKQWREPSIVPRVLDGDDATLTRGAAIAILLLAIVASIVVALAAAKALADAVS